MNKTDVSLDNNDVLVIFDKWYRPAPKKFEALKQMAVIDQMAALKDASDPLRFFISTISCKN